MRSTSRRSLALLAIAFTCGGSLLACSLLISTNDYVGTRPNETDSSIVEANAIDAVTDADGDADSSTALPGPLYVYYRFDQNVLDSSGNGRTGTLAGATALLDAGGAIGNALSCANPGDHVLIGGDFRPGSSSFTVALFYRIQMLSDGGAARPFNTLLDKGSAWEDSTNDAPGFGLGYNGPSETVQGFIRDNIATHTWLIAHGTGSGTLLLRDGKFHHVALVVDRDAATPQVSIFVDGTLADFTNIPADYGPIDSTDTGKVCTEGNEPTTVELGGAIDELMIIGRALTASEVAALAARTHD